SINPVDILQLGRKGVAKKQASSRVAPDPGRQFLLHTVATVAYRGGKAVRGAPSRFGHFRAGATSRTSVEILAHVGDLFDWALALANGKHVWRGSAPLPWNREVRRF